jgi:iron(III) transport system ATP-binding protein
MLDVENISIGYSSPQGWVQAVKAVSFTLNKGDIGCLLGPSGCGKTTVLRAVAGFEPLQDGRIVLQSRVLSTPEQVVPAERRSMGMMFQDYALFPHLNVQQNIGFGLQRLSSSARNSRVTELLALVGLAGFEKRFPHELSGGQQQRVALARSLAPQPSLLLLDEPFSNLDVDTRERLAFELRDILKETGLTILLVTHNHDEAFALGDQIGVMNEGQLLQWGTPASLTHYPASEMVQTILRRDTLFERRQNARLRGQFE